ncbi:MAG: helix-turn-helix domain-containing protein [Owenweeksia sp.]|nr:helix-turn-helix domain-containing protein [Owenweeksia sp.]
MANKKEKIISTALALFAKMGYDATSTSKIALSAGVSEGLIFRHFKNKEGLLESILTVGRDKIWQLYRPILEARDPREILRKVISLPFDIPADQLAFWRLTYALKWRSETYDYSLTEPLNTKLKEAFYELGYFDPVAETEVVLLMMDGLIHSLLLRAPTNQEAIRLVLFSKYLL